MGESQSRYSIVSKLTETKLEIMQQKSNLVEEVTKQKQKIINLETDLGNWKQDVEEDKKRAERKRIIAIEDEKRQLTNLEERLGSKQKVYDEQLKSIDEALKSIEEISKTSPTITTK